ncbi:MAG TPA: Ig-like domain-containing protein [Fluviicoccus sp.]|nr:Ig-like domain-containing protein [Fluviicoccus sp.]
MLSALMVVSCGSDSITLPGMSSDQLQLLAVSGTLTVPLSGSLEVGFSLKDDSGAPRAGKTVTVRVASGNAGLLDKAGTLTDTVNSLNVVTAADGTGAFLVRGLALNSTGIIEVKYVDDKSNTRTQQFAYVVGTNVNSVNTIDLTATSATVATSGDRARVTVSALVKSKSTGLPLSGRTVTFTKPDGFGTLSSVTAVSGVDGKASVIFDGTNSTPGTGIVQATYTDASGNIATSSITLQVIKDYVMNLSSQTTSLSTGSDTLVTLSAFVLDSGNTAVTSSDGLKVTYSIVQGDGFLETPSAISDTGLSQVKYHPNAANILNRDIVIRATLANVDGRPLPTPVQGDITISIGGNAVTMQASQTNVLDGDVVQFNGKVVTGQGSPVPNKTVNLTADGLTGVPATVTTKADGTFQVLNVTVNTAGAATANLTASVDGLATSSLQTVSSLSVSQKNFKLEAAKSDDIQINVPQEVEVRLSDTADVTGRVVNFASTLGAIQDLAGNPITKVTLADTDPADGKFIGSAKFRVVSPYPGTALVEAFAKDADNNDLQISKRFTFISVTPTKLTIQATSPNLASSQATDLLVRAYDAKDNPVKNVRVNFNKVEDPSNGDLSSASVLTDATGLAKVVFTAGPRTTAKNAVQITALAPDFSPAVTSVTQYLTVGGEALFLSIGTGNVISNLPSAPDTTYSLPHQVMVTDSTGAPIANSDVQLSVVPLTYNKGYYVLDAITSTWGIEPTSFYACPNEDTNLNGILEASEDNGIADPATGDVIDNKDGILWPGNPVTLSAKTVRTDANGVASFDLVYAKSYANWLKVMIVATATVKGSESRAERTVTLLGMVDDFKKDKLPPGGLISPYGQKDPSTGADACSYKYY